MSYSIFNTGRGKYRHTNRNDSIHEIDTETGEEKLIGSGMQMGIKHGMSHETKCRQIESFKFKKAAAEAAKAKAL